MFQLHGHAMLEIIFDSSDSFIFYVYHKKYWHLVILLGGML